MYQISMLQYTSWQYFKQGKQCMFQSPRCEEVIMSTYTATPSKSSPERDRCLNQLFENGLQVARKVAMESNLRVIKPLAEDAGVCDLPCWTVVAETLTRDALFAEAVIRHSHGTVLLTYEAPFVDGAERMFRDLLRMIHGNLDATKNNGHEAG
jgi:hypothetical protein